MSLTSDIAAYLENQGVTVSDGDIETWQVQQGNEVRLKQGRDRMITLELQSGDAADTHVPTFRGATLHVIVRSAQHDYAGCLTTFTQVFDCLQDMQDVLNADAEVETEFSLIHSDLEGPAQFWDRKDRPNMSAYFRLKTTKVPAPFTMDYSVEFQRVAGWTAG